MKALKILLISNLLLFLFGCDKNGENIFLEGNIVGFVSLVDNTGNEVIDKSGVIVTIEGLPRSANTNTDGRFEFAHIPAGTYNLIFNKTGYGVYKRFSYQFIGGNLPALVNETTLFELPDIAINSLNISFENNIISISAKMNATNSFSIQTFLNDSSNVSNLNYDYYTGRYNYIGSGYTGFSQNIYLSETPYHTGQKIYLSVYFINPHEEWTYYDYEKGEYIFSSYTKATGVINLTLE